jgi:hypothetical protein
MHSRWNNIKRMLVFMIASFPNNLNFFSRTTNESGTSAIPEKSFTRFPKFWNQLLLIFPKKNFFLSFKGMSRIWQLNEYVENLLTNHLTILWLVLLSYWAYLAYFIKFLIGILQPPSILIYLTRVWTLSIHCFNVLESF